MYVTDFYKLTAFKTVECYIKNKKTKKKKKKKEKPFVNTKLKRFHNYYTLKIFILCLSKKILLLNDDFIEIKNSDSLLQYNYDALILFLFFKRSLILCLSTSVQPNAYF